MCTLGHQNRRKIEVRFLLIFVYPAGVMKIRENWRVRFLLIFLYRGSWKSKKIKVSDFCQFSCTRGHENWRKLKSWIFVNFRVPEVIKIRKNWGVGFLLIFVYPGSWKLEKNEVPDFCDYFSWKSEKNKN